MPKNKPPIQRFPKTAERRYTQYLLRYVRRISKAIIEKSNQYLPTVVEEAKRKLINDDFTDTISDLVSSINIELSGLAVINSLDQGILETAEAINTQNRKEMTKIITQILGISLSDYEPAVGEQMKAFQKENIALIKSLTTQQVERVEPMIYRGVRQGLSYSQIMKDIQADQAVSRNRARLIARDQTNKFNGQLSQIRQKSVGVKEYRWRNANDSRVRGNPSGLYPKAKYSHWNREGKKFKWNEPPPDGHPGEPIQCRCWAEPVIEELENQDDVI